MQQKLQPQKQQKIQSGAFYEESRDIDEALNVRRNKNYIFPSHFHRNIEILIVNRGEQQVTHNGVSYTLKSGNVFFCSSYDIHSYGEMKAIEEKNHDDALIILPSRYTARFNERNQGLRPVSPIISNARLCAETIAIADRWMLPNVPSQIANAATELLLSLIEAELEMHEDKEKDETQLIKNILSYLSAHFRENLSLSGIAKRFGYAEAHVSRVFHRYTRTGLPRYINALRLNEVEQRLNNSPDDNLTQAIFDAGFKSIPTYYRAKEQLRSSAAPKSRNSKD